MTLVKRSGFSPMPSFFDDFWTKDWFDGFTSRSTMPAVNIQETGEEFIVEMAAPGMQKDDFNLELDNDILTISSKWEDKVEDKDESGNYTRREFSYNAFSRSFTLPNTVEADKIKAKYTDGVLRLMIPKKEEAKQKPARQISIS